MTAAKERALGDVRDAAKELEKAKQRRERAVKKAARICSVREVAAAAGLSVTRTQFIIREGQVRVGGEWVDAEDAA